MSRPVIRAGLVYKTLNTDFGLGHDHKMLVHECEGVDVLLLQEVKNVNLQAALPAGWTALQNRSDEGHAGAAIAYRDATAEQRHRVLRTLLAAIPFIRGRRIKMLNRYIAAAPLWEKATGIRHYPVSAHFPPDRFSALDPGYEKRLRRLIKRHPNAIIGTDANQSVHALAHRLGLVCAAEGIVGLMWRQKRYRRVGHTTVSSWAKRHHYTDHPSVSRRLARRGKGADRRLERARARAAR